MRGRVAARATERISSGNEALDRLLGGGFPRGELSEIAAPPGAGLTSLAYGLLAFATARGEIAAWIDGADRFDPQHAARAGIVLPSVLWVRPKGPLLALRCCELLLGTRGFGLVLLDLADGFPPKLAARMVSAWPRLARKAASSHTALLLLSRERLAGSFASLCLSLSAARPLWPVHALRPPLFAGIESQVALARSRQGGVGERVRLCFLLDHGTDHLPLRS